MDFEKLPSRDGYQTWGCWVGDTSCIIGFDGKHPDRGYSASYKKTGAEKVMLGEGFATKAAARHAIERAVGRIN